MKYEEARDYLHSALTFGIQLGLQRMNRLLDLLGHPENGLQTIHIAGTNGKGSTTSYCASILAAGGFRVGVYTSPYIERFTERIRVIDGLEGLARLADDETHGEIGPVQFAAIMTDIRTAVDQMLAEGDENPTEFELITAAAFIHFQREQCDWIVLETGLGGRLDSTNVIASPARIIITALGYDHMDRLGDTLPKIAAEKAGIIKVGCPVWLYDPIAAAPGNRAEATAARQLIIDRCRELQSPLTILEPAMVVQIDYQLSGQSFLFAGQVYTTRLLGLFQPLNAALALSACAGLVPRQAAIEGISQTRWPGRLEVFPGCNPVNQAIEQKGTESSALPRVNQAQQALKQIGTESSYLPRVNQAKGLIHPDPMVLIDGAHNPQGCLALGDALDRLLPGQPVVFLVGLLADKDYPAMLEALFANRKFRTLDIICVTPENPRALPAVQLANHVAELKMNLHSGYNVRDMIHTIDQPEQGLAKAVAIASTQRAAVCAFGSLYLVGQLRTWIRNRPCRDREDPQF